MAEALYWEHAICHVSVYLFIQCLTSQLSFALYGLLPVVWLSAALMILLFLAIFQQDYRHLVEHNGNVPAFLLHVMSPSPAPAFTLPFCLPC